MARELRVHIAIAGMLRAYLKDGWRTTHPASGEIRDKRTAAKIRAMGQNPGWPDIILVSPEGRFHGLEIKGPGGSLSTHQRDFRNWCRDHAIPWATVRSVDEAAHVLSDWGALRLPISVQS